MNEIMTQILILIMVLSVLANIITEVFKATTAVKSAKAINIFVLIVSVMITMLAMSAFWQIRGLVISGYALAAFFTLGVLVAYSAMFGYDKLLSQFKVKEG